MYTFKINSYSQLILTIPGILLLQEKERLERERIEAEERAKKLEEERLQKVVPLFSYVCLTEIHTFVHDIMIVIPYSLKFSRLKNFTVFAGYTYTTIMLSPETFSTCCIRTYALYRTHARP